MRKYPIKDTYKDNPAFATACTIALQIWFRNVLERENKALDNRVVAPRNSWLHPIPARTEPLWLTDVIFDSLIEANDDLHPESAGLFKALSEHEITLASVSSCLTLESLFKVEAKLQANLTNNGPYQQHFSSRR